jgi:hypothetical protein
MDTRRMPVRLALFVALALLAAACTVEQPTDVPATATPTPAATTTAEPTTAAPAYRTVTIPEIGLSLEVPAGWDRLEPAWSWAPPGQAEPRPVVGVKWTDLVPPQEVEAALLPGPSQITESEAVDLSWASGRRFTLEVYGEGEGGEGEEAPVASREIHVLLVPNLEEGRLGIDLYAAAETSGQLENVRPALQHMLDSSRLE